MGKNNVSSQSSGRLSVPEFLEYLKTDSTLFGWDAILAFDRVKTNIVLLQEYIERFSGASWFPPVSFEGDTTPGVVERVIDYRLDKPRLWFDRADMENSRVDLRMRIVGGKQFTIENPNNVKLRQITRLKMADAINGPVLHMRALLSEVNVALSRNRVGLDLSKATRESFYLTYADTEEENFTGGLMFWNIFERWSSAQKVFEISQLEKTDNVIKPSAIAIRTQPAPGDSEDGVVVVFVLMEGSDGSGTAFPSKNHHYLLPGNKGEYSAAITFARKNLLAEVMPKVMQAFPGYEDKFAGAYVGGELIGTGGYCLRHEATTWGLPDREHTVSVAALGYAFKELDWMKGKYAGNFKASLENSQLVIRWSGVSSVLTDVYVTPTSGTLSRGFMDCTFSVQLVYGFKLGAEGVILALVNAAHNVSVEYSNDWTNAARFRPQLESMAFRSSVQAVMLAYLTEQVSKFSDLGIEYNLFLMNNLLFRNRDVFEAELVAQPNPLFVLGQLAPALTTFQIDPVETVVGAGRTFTFKITGANVPVTWSVANLPDGSGQAGHINPETGVYTAPARADLPDNHKRVIVTARAKTGGAVSQALVGIVSRDIGLDPIVLMANKGARGYKVRATPLDASETLTFRLSAGAQGQLIDDPDADPDATYSKLYVPPASQAGIAPGPQAIPAQWLAYRKTPAWTLEEELSEYLHVEQVLAAGSKGSEQEVEVLLLLQNITNWFVFKPSGQGIELEHWSTNKKNGDHIVPKEKTFWFLVKGSGTLVDGVYTPDPSADETYAVIVAIEANDDVYKWVPAILPIPFVGVETYLDMVKEDLK